MKWFSSFVHCALLVTGLINAGITVAQERPEGAGLSPVPTRGEQIRVEMSFSREVEFGTRDENGQWLSGTETMRILRHNDQLFASTGLWTDLPYRQAKDGRPWTGPQILRKDTASSAWQVDQSFPQSVRIDGLYSALFETDATGSRLTPAVSMLVASGSNWPCIMTRNDQTGQWTLTPGPENDRVGIRSFCTHLDRSTDTQSLFGGGHTKGAIYRAVYDVNAPGRLRWLPEAELSGTGRVMAMTEADGVLYAACGIKDDSPYSGGLFRRIDGENPRWELVLRWPYKIVADETDERTLMRGLTVVPDPLGGEKSVILGTCHDPGVIYRIDPNRDFELSVELDVRAYFTRVFNIPELKGPCLSAYNDMLEIIDPDTGEIVHLIGFWINAPASASTEMRESAWYLIRDKNGNYRH